VGTERADMQRKSKLERYEDILQALAGKPLTVDTVAYELNMDCFALRSRISFLIKNGLVEERSFRNKTCYALTRRGWAIYKTLVITRRLEKLQISIARIDEALQAIPAIPENGEETAKR
jgi:predicted transcriptional regulator